ncbi:MAG: hypothetical protein PSU93_09450 [Methylobacter sp.]|uniref:Uncharacterized protein n=1 Tax=Candidatus Methylobacter titanis TaxID=3053457 RepID=A0AA43Q7U3_9GAMM|nr:hypothetical protein [Candidatus Methylobacter titanis]
MAKSKLEQLKQRLERQSLKVRPVRGYFVSHYGYSNEGVFCADLDAVERHINKVEEQND